MAERARGAGGGAAVCGPHGGAGDACCAARPAGRGPRLCRGVEGFGIACVHFLPPASRRRCGAALLAAIPVCPSDAGPRPAASVCMSLRPSARAMSARVRLICPRPAVRLRRRPSACVARPSTSSSCLQLRPAHPAIAIAKAMARAKAKAMARAITRANAMTKNNYQPSSVTYRRRAGAGHGGLHRRGGRWGACAVQVYEKCARGATKPCKMRARCCIMQNTRWGGVRIVLITGWKGG